MPGVRQAAPRASEGLLGQVPGSTQPGAQGRGAPPTTARGAGAVDAALGLETKGIGVQAPKDFDSFFATAKRLGAGAVLVPNVAWFRPQLERIGAAAAKSHLPAIGYDRQFAESGRLLSYGPTSLQNLPRLAAQIDKILKGAKPADCRSNSPPSSNW
jgi:ABC-type uncharacterized transport system substrate-binding protein